MIHLESGDKARALDFLERGPGKARDAGDRAQESLILENLGRISIT
jgi:hypothetical protein